MRCLLNHLRLLCDVWAVRRGHARRIARPGKWTVWREASFVMVSLHGGTR